MEIYFKSTLKTERSRNKMNVKALLVFLVLIVVFFARESEAYGGDLPGGKRKKIQRKREYEVSFKNNYLFISSLFPPRFRSDRGSCSYISLLLVAQIIHCKCSSYCKI